MTQKDHKETENDNIKMQNSCKDTQKDSWSIQKGAKQSQRDTRCLQRCKATMGRCKNQQKLPQKQEHREMHYNYKVMQNNLNQKEA